LSCRSLELIRFATAWVSWGGGVVHVGEPVGEGDRQLLAGGALGDAGADLIGEGQLPAQVVRPSGADPEVGADRGDAVVLAQSGAGLPAVAQLLLLVGEGELLALVGLRLDPADLIRARLVVEQQHDQAANRLQGLESFAADELVAGFRGEIPALPVVEQDRAVGVWAVADAGDQLARAA